MTNTLPFSRWVLYGLKLCFLFALPLLSALFPFVSNASQATRTQRKFIKTMNKISAAKASDKRSLHHAQSLYRSQYGGHYAQDRSAGGNQGGVYWQNEVNLSPTNGDRTAFVNRDSEAPFGGPMNNPQSYDAHSGSDSSNSGYDLRQPSYKPLPTNSQGYGYDQPVDPPYQGEGSLKVGGYATGVGQDSYASGFAGTYNDWGTGNRNVGPTSGHNGQNSFISYAQGSRDATQDHNNPHNSSPGYYNNSAGYAFESGNSGTNSGGHNIAPTDDTSSYRSQNFGQYGYNGGTSGNMDAHQGAQHFSNQYASPSTNSYTTQRNDGSGNSSPPDTLWHNEYSGSESWQQPHPSRPQQHADAYQPQAIQHYGSGTSPSYQEIHPGSIYGYNSTEQQSYRRVMNNIGREYHRAPENTSDPSIDMNIDMFIGEFLANSGKIGLRHSVDARPRRISGQLKDSAVFCMNVKRLCFSVVWQKGRDDIGTIAMVVTGDGTQQSADEAIGNIKAFIGTVTPGLSSENISILLSKMGILSGADIGNTFIVKPNGRRIRYEYTRSNKVGLVIIASPI